MIPPPLSAWFPIGSHSARGETGRQNDGPRQPLLGVQMSELQSILMTAKEGLALGQSIPQSRWAAIAAQCGKNEIVEIHQRISKLQMELETIEDWDGDTQDDIHIAIDFFTRLAAMCAK